MLYQQKSRNLDKSQRVDNQQVDARQFPKSGFDLKYRSYNDYQLGKLHVSGYHHTMPGDKFSGRNSGQFMFNEMVTPTVSPIEVCQHNFYMPYRSLDTSFEDAFAPEVRTGMSESWKAPCFTLNELSNKFMFNLGWTLFTNGTTTGAFIIDALLWLYLHHYQPSYDFEGRTLSGSPFDFLYTRSNLSSPIRTWCMTFNDVYLSDVFLDTFRVTELENTHLSDVDFREDALMFYDYIVRPLFGEGSLLDSLGYPYIRRTDWLVLIEHLEVNSIMQDTPIQDLIDSYTDVLNDAPVNEYPIRAYYAIWYEYYRDANLEPVTNNLPKYRHWNNTPVVPDNLWLLIVRPRCWQHDMHVSAMPDDPFRHVYAPVVTVPSNSLVLNGRVSYHAFPADYLDAEIAPNQGAPIQNQNGINSYTIGFLDTLTGSERSVTCPVPSLVNDSLIHGDLQLGSHGILSLQSLRQSQALERVLKRNFYFGDEYKDRMFAHYGSVVSDDRVNRPAVLSSSVSSINTQEQIANIGTVDTPVGTRTVVVSAGSDNDGYSFYSEEFGIVLNIISFMPIAQYAGLCPQLLQDKVVSFPLPEFATQFSEASRVCEVAMTGLYTSNAGSSDFLFGHQPYGHAYRMRVDEVHGSYLSDKYNQTFARFFGMDDQSREPKLNYSFIHCLPPLGMFRNSVRLDGQLFGYVVHDFFVERPLPTPAEEI